MTPQLKAFVAAHTPLVLEEIRNFFTEQKTASDLAPHFLHSLENIEEFVLRGGKNVRSLLTILAFRLGGQTDAAIYQAAAGVELFHKHILNIDDMADRDEQRYGGPTLQKKYEQEFNTWQDAAHHGRSFAEIDGTLLGSFAFELVRTSQFSPEKILAVMEVMNRTMYWRTVMGWQIHYFQNYQPLAEANEEEFLRGIDLVSSEYTFVAPLKIGLILAGKSEDEVLKSALMTYAQKVGRAFQIQDDILGVFGDTEETGKPVGNDIREGKKTLLLQRAFQNASPEDKKFLVAVCGQPLDQEQLEKVRQLMKQTGALQYSQEMAAQLVREGLLAISPLHNSEEKAVLGDLSEHVIERKK